MKIPLLKHFLVYLITVVLIITSSLLISQQRLSIHIKELINNQATIVEFDKTDEIARSIQQIDRSQTILSREIVGYLPYWMYSEYPYLRFDLLTQINYFSAELDSYGNITNYHHWFDSDFVSFAHDRNVKVKLCATLFGVSSLQTLLNNPQNRSNAIQNLLSAVAEMDGDGVDIDFELLPSSMRDSLSVFMEELTSTFHSNLPGSIVTMATPAVDWSDAWDYELLARITDGLFIMGYDYHWSGSSTAGPVSPLGGFYYDLSYSVNDYMDKTGFQVEKIILGLPYYGYDWPVIDNEVYSHTTGSATARTFANTQDMILNVGFQFSEETSSNWLTYFDSEWNQCWFDDSLSLSLKYQYADNNELSGIGMWALGYDGDDPELWGAIEDQFFLCETGDLNQDSVLDIYDVLRSVAIVLSNGLYPSDYELCSSDINQDSLINITDIVLLNNLIID